MVCSLSAESNAIYTVKADLIGASSHNSGAVAQSIHQILNRGSPGSNTLWCRFEALVILFSPRCHSFWRKCMYLLADKFHINYNVHDNFQLLNYMNNVSGTVFYHPLI